MPRQGRVRGESGVYHVTLRGVDRRDIFRDDVDRWRFLGLLAQARNQTGAHLLAFCLMTNHVHLLVHTPDGPPTAFVRRVAGRYGAWYNHRHQRTGHLFEGRYHSQPVDDDRYLAAAVSYVHTNPVRAGLCGTVQEYEWVSPRWWGEPGGLVDLGWLRGYVDLADVRRLDEETERRERDKRRPGPEVWERMGTAGGVGR